VAEGVGRSDGALFEAIERGRFTFPGCSGLAVNRGDAAGVGVRLWVGIPLVEGTFAGPSASGCNEVTLGGSAWTALRLNFEVGGPIEYFFVEEKDDLVDRWWRLSVSSFTGGGACTGVSSFTTAGACTDAASSVVVVVVEVPALLSLRLMSPVVSVSVETIVASADVL
jgi:hypothetical protein